MVTTAGARLVDECESARLKIEEREALMMRKQAEISIVREELDRVNK